jgi:bifunctional non-homologous end joining protein LigD
MTPTFMLAKTSIAIPDRTLPVGWPSGWLAEQKVDGVRVMVVIDKSVTLISRSGRDITPQFPDLVAAIDRLRLGRVTLDAELTAGTFAQTNGRMHLTRARDTRCRALVNPAELHVFDILRSGEHDLTGDELQMRKALLQRLPFNGTVHLVRSFGEDEQAAIDAVFEENLEGVMLKDPASRYVGKRSTAWVKAKRQRSVTCLAVGWEHGNGSREDSFGALLLGLVEGGHLLRVGKVGSGFTERDLAEISSLLRDSRPFALEVTYLEVSENNQLRFPVFQRLRPDVDVLSADILQCSVDQISKRLPSS